MWPRVYMQAAASFWMFVKSFAEVFAFHEVANHTPYLNKMIKRLKYLCLICRY